MSTPATQPDTEALRQRAERWLEDHRIYHREGAALIRDLLAALPAQRAMSGGAVYCAQCGQTFVAYKPPTADGVAG
jgi:hypothetical protein